MIKTAIVAVFVFMLCCPLTILADTISPTHSCDKPIKPYKFKSQDEVDIFMVEVDRYQDCINTFIEEQNAAIEIHREAALAAVKEWDDFDKNELK